MKARRSTARPMGDYAVVIHGRWKGTDPPANLAGHHASVITAYLDRISDARPTRVSCALCDWEGFEGPAGEARAAGLEHRRQAHPETLGKKRPLKKGAGLGPKPMWQQSLEDQQNARLRGSAASAKGRS